MLMKVCYLGTYDADYVRNRVIIAGLRSQGVEVVECHAALWRGTDDKVWATRQGLLNPGLWWRVLRAYGRLLRLYRRVGRYDVLVVGYAGHMDMFLARLLTWLRRKPLVFDVFLSWHETVVHDRQLLRPHSLLAALLYGVEKVACLLADRLLLDTEAHISYFMAKYGLSRERFRCIRVGAEEDLFTPVPAEPAQEPFTVTYFGKFIPLHGMEHVIRAAGALQGDAGIRFDLIGGGQTYDEMRALARALRIENITWGPGWLDPVALHRRIGRADVFLGIFGASPKALRVIPTKAYVALAMGKPLVTSDSAAAREVLTAGENALLVAPGDPQAIAAAILALKRDPTLRQRIAQGGRHLYLSQLSTHHIGAQAKRVLEELVSR
ncbi:MAG: glycosyltransferase [Chloroflexota bacterium]